MLNTPTRLRRTGRVGLIVTALGLAIATSVANPAFASGANRSPQPMSKAAANAGGAFPLTPPKAEHSKVEYSKVEHSKAEYPKVYPPKVEHPKAEHPKAEYPKVYPPKVEHPKAENPTVVVQPQVLGEVLVAPAAAPQVRTPAAAQPQVLGEVLVAPAAAPKDSNPLPTSAAAGQADASGQLVAGGFAAFAALLALGSGVVLRRRYGDA